MIYVLNIVLHLPVERLNKATTGQVIQVNGWPIWSTFSMVGGHLILFELEENMRYIYYYRKLVIVEFQ